MFVHYDFNEHDYHIINLSPEVWTATFVCKTKLSLDDVTKF